MYAIHIDGLGFTDELETALTTNNTLLRRSQCVNSEILNNGGFDETALEVSMA